MDDYIAHYGIKGMRWGVRRTPEQLGHTEPKKSIKDMTDEELRKKVSRAELESRYISLTQKKSQSTVKKLLKEGVENLARRLMNEGIDKLFNKKENIDIKDPNKATTKELQEANKWIAQRKLYEKNVKDLFDDADGILTDDFIIESLFGSSKNSKEFDDIVLK